MLAFFQLAYWYWQKNPLAKKYKQKLLAEISTGANARKRWETYWQILLQYIVFIAWPNFFCFAPVTPPIQGTMPHT